MGLHKDSVDLDNHRIHNLEFADAATRLGAIYVAEDKGKVYKDLDTVTHWVLANHVGPIFNRVDASGGGASGFVLYLTDVDTPSVNYVEGIEVWDWDKLGDQVGYAILPVPESYIAGSQIVLENGEYATPVTVNNVHIKTETQIIRDETTVLGALGAAHTSTNVEKTVQGVANTIDPIGDLDLTDGAGEISGTPIAPGDTLLVKFFRDVAAESVTADDDARMLTRSFIPTFGV